MEELSPNLKSIYKALLELHKNAYIPITHFAVSCILKTKNGKYYKGVNVEDATTRAGACAERSAIFAAISDGVKPGEFDSINIMVSSGDIGTPCFVCRAMINEVFDEDSIVRCWSTKGEVKEYKVSELCPYSFGEEDIHKKVI